MFQPFPYDSVGGPPRARARARGPVRCSSKHVVISSARTYIVQLIPDLALTRVRVSCIVVIVDHVEHVLFPRVVHAFFSPCGTCVVVISPMRYMHDTCILHNFLMFELCLRVYIAFSVSHCLIYQVVSGINSVFGVFVMSYTYFPNGRAYSLESTRIFSLELPHLGVPRTVYHRRSHPVFRIESFTEI